MKKYLYALLVLIWASLAGCATNPVTGGQDLVLMSESQEIALGQKTHGQILKQYQVYNDPEINELVNRLGQELAAQSHRSHLDFTFTVLDSPQVNAFATPGGYIYITRGIMAYMNSEEQLAGVLGHEIGHVTARHSVRQQTAQTASGLASVVAAILTKSNSVGQAVGQASQGFTRSYGRKHELQADRLGAQYLAGIGYDPEMMLGVVGILKDQEQFELQRAKEEKRQPRVYHGVYSTHPRNDQRLQEVIRAAEEFKIPNAKYNNPDEFLRLMEGMTFGSSEDQGVLRDNQFYHKLLNLAISFPEDWDVDNQPSQLLVVNRQRTQAIVIRLKDPGNSRNPEQYLRQQFSNVRQLQAIDNDSFAGIVDGKTPFGQGSARVAAVFHGNNVLEIHGFGKQQLPDQQVANTVRSVRTLRGQEKKLASAKRIKLIRARNGDTFAKLARRSNLDRYAEEQLRLLNGLYPTGEPIPGELIKVIQ